MKLEPMSETRRLVYGAVGVIVGIAINRIAGLHIVLRHVAVDGLTGTNNAWFALFCLGLAVGFGIPMWFWLVRPTLTDAIERVDPGAPVDR